MSHFLVVYDQRAGKVLSLTRFENAANALQRRFEAERNHQGEPGIEVVVLTAANRAALRRTHGRYFKSVRELAATA